MITIDTEETIVSCSVAMVANHSDHNVLGVVMVRMLRFRAREIMSGGN
jgi:hypothetical protein